MAKITLTIVDADLTSDNYDVHFHAEGSEIDQGRATAAYFTGFFLHTMIPTPDFAFGLTEFRESLISRAVSAGVSEASETPATVKLTITDEDLTTGRYSAMLVTEIGDKSGERLLTAAQVVGAYMRSLVSDIGFVQACWRFAEEFVKNNGGAITNVDQAPANTNEDAASAA